MKKIKFTWGTGIFLVIVTFVSFFVSFIIFSQTQTINFETEDYYSKGVKYEEQIIKVKNTKALDQKVKMEQDAHQISLIFPEIFSGKDIKGQIQFYYYLDYKLDKIVQIKVDDVLHHTTSTDSFAKGRYQIRIDWTAGGKSYYQEIETVIN